VNKVHPQLQTTTLKHKLCALRSRYYRLACQVSARSAEEK